jgi:hypothetical protein
MRRLTSWAPRRRREPHQHLAVSRAAGPNPAPVDSDERPLIDPLMRGILGRIALVGERRSHARMPAAVVTRPAKRNAVWRSEDSRSNGSSAEMASRGITTSYQRSAALAAV